MKPSDQIPDHIDDDIELSPLKQQFSMEPPAELDQRVKQSFRRVIAGQDNSGQNPSLNKHTWYQQLQTCWQLANQAPAIVACLLLVSLLTGLLSGLNMPSPWRDEAQPLKPADTKLILRNGDSTAQTRAIAKNAQLPSEQWLEIIAELLVQQRVEEANIQLQAYRRQYPK